MKRVEDIVVGDTVEARWADVPKAHTVSGFGHKSVTITGSYGAVMLNKDITHINGQPVIAGVDVCVDAATDSILSSPEMDELRAYAVNELLDACKPCEETIDEVARCFGMLLDERKIEVVR